MNRRTLTIVLTVGIVLTSVIGGVYVYSGDGTESDPPTATVGSEWDDSYVLEQGDGCQRIEPLSTDESVEEFYDYRDHETHPPGVDRAYSSYGTTHLQEDDTSVLFLHEGPDGLSLVMVHDRVDGDTGGGMASFEIGGLPVGSEWAVKNDDYGDRNSPTDVDEFEAGSGWASASWAWRGERTAGGALHGGFDGEFAATVYPAFNDEAELADKTTELSEAGLYDDGKIDRWVVLSGDEDDPDRTPLSLSDPVTVRTGTCDSPSINYERTGGATMAHVEDADAGDPLTVTAATGSNGVEFGALEVTPESEGLDLEFAEGDPDSLADSRGNVEALSSLELPEEGIENETTVHFAVEKETLEERDLEPENVVLYENGGAEWTETETAMYDESDDAYHFVAEPDSASAVTVAVAEDRGLSLGPTSRPVLAVLATIALSAFLWVRRTRG